MTYEHESSDCMDPPKNQTQTEQTNKATMHSRPVLTNSKANLHHSCTSEQRTQSILYYDGQPSLTKAHGFGSQWNILFAVAMVEQNFWAWGWFIAISRKHGVASYGTGQLIWN